MREKINNQRIRITKLEREMHDASIQREHDIKKYDDLKNERNYWKKKYENNQNTKSNSNFSGEEYLDESK
ncbi:MAG: hypothetical protein HRO68_07770 [Nitrosopumilus sp.]|nr:hypothetical protein [Nitrosopumilus sp.]